MAAWLARPSPRNGIRRRVADLRTTCAVRLKVNLRRRRRCYSLAEPDVARAANAGAAVEILDAVFATRPRDEWLRILRAGGDFIFTVVKSVDDLPNDPQVQANGSVVDFEHL